MELKVKIKEVTHTKRNKKDFWLRVITDNGVACGRSASELQPNERVILLGDWDVFGGQKYFKFTSVKADIDITKKELLYYACELTSGLGAKTADQIYARYGDDWEVVLNDARLDYLNIKRMTENKLNNLIETLLKLEQKKQETKTIIALMSRTLSETDARKAWEKWQDKAVQIVDSDCYRLSELSGIGFQKVDISIRHFYKITDGDLRRIRAGIKYSFKTLTDGISATCVELQLLVFEILGLISIDEKIIIEEINKLIETGELVLINNNYITNAQYDKCERLIWEFAKCN